MIFWPRLIRWFYFPLQFPIFLFSCRWFHLNGLKYPNVISILYFPYIKFKKALQIDNSAVAEVNLLTSIYLWLAGACSELWLCLCVGRVNSGRRDANPGPVRGKYNSFLNYDCLKVARAAVPNLGRYQRFLPTSIPFLLLQHTRY